MKAVILAGGLGTRISEETGVRPKPMVEIGSQPILWHIMKIYAAHGVNEFIVCCGYKGHVIKEYFANYAMQTADVCFDLSTNQMTLLGRRTEPWKVTLVDTGPNTMTGGRLKRVRDYVGDDTFCMTYGDGVSDVNISEAIRFHTAHRRKATLTAVQPPGRFGTFSLGRDNPSVRAFVEKPKGGDGAWINGGFFVLEPSVIDYIEGDHISFEHGPLDGLARDGELMAFTHDGFWHPMDTLRDKGVLNDLWAAGKAPWMVWDGADR